jgi:ribonuclease HI
MATAAYGIEAIWEGQPWMVQSFHKLTARIGKDVSGTFESTMAVDAIREAETPPTRAALDRRTERQFIRMITNSSEHPCKNYIDECDQDPEFGSPGRWLTRSSDGLWVRGQHVEQTTPLALGFTDWLDEDESSVHNDKDSLHLYTDGSLRTCAALGWTLRDVSNQEIYSGSGSLGPVCTAFDMEVAVIENEISALLRCRRPFNYITVHSDSTAEIARVQYNKRGPGQSRAVKVIRHVQRLRNQGKRVSISWIKGHNGNTGNDADALAGRAAENIPQSTSNLQLVSTVSHGGNNEARGTIIVRPPLRAA